MMLWLSDIEQRPIEAAAAVVGIAEPLAAARLTRARLMLAKALCRQVTSVAARHRTTGMSALRAPSASMMIPVSVSRERDGKAVRV